MYTTRTFCNFRKTHCDLYTGKYGNWPRPDQTQWQTILGMQRMKFTLQSTCINRPFIKGFIRKLHFVITEKKANADLYTGKYGNQPRPDQPLLQMLSGVQRTKFTLQSTCISQSQLQIELRKHP